MATWPINQWYVAAYGSEIEGGLFARTICNEPIVFYRTKDGTVRALADRCVHRRFPLSESHLVDDEVVCGYHGFTYGPDGRCTKVPGQTRIPRSARVPAFTVVEQDSLVWVWIGPGEPNADAIPRAPWLADEKWASVRGMEPLKARYELLVDNLLDLSHETYLHGGYIGTPEVAETPITTEVDEEQGVVYVSRHMDDAECPSFYQGMTGITGRITRWQDIEYHAPCLYMLHSRIAPQGVVPPQDGPDDQAFHVEINYAITPETEHSTHDFWMVSRDFAIDDEKMSTFIHDNNRTVVLQDVVALDLLEGVIEGEKDRYQELSINIDTGALAARRILNDQIRSGQDDGVPSPTPAGSPAAGAERSVAPAGAR